MWFPEFPEQLNVTDHDTDDELMKIIPREDLEIIRGASRGRWKQLSRWHAGANFWIRWSLRRTRRRWALLCCKLMGPRDRNRRKLLSIVRQQRGLMIVTAFENWFMRRLCRLFGKLPVRLKEVVMDFV